MDDLHVHRQLMPLEALQYPQAYNASCKLKRTYHVKRDWNKRKDKAKASVHRRSMSEVICSSDEARADSDPEYDSTRYNGSFNAERLYHQLNIDKENDVNTRGAWVQIPEADTNNDSDNQGSDDGHEPATSAASRPAVTGESVAKQQSAAKSDNSVSRSPGPTPKDRVPVLPQPSAVSGSAPAAGDAAAGCSGPGKWTEDFDLLLADPLATRLFSEFLETQFSEENIKFWISCQKYKTTTDGEELLRLSRDIYSTHLATDATEPVNVDSGARQAASEAVRVAEESGKGDPNIFNVCQKQIYNLMKMDTFPRFLQSQICKDHLDKEEKSQAEMLSQKKQGRYIKKGDTKRTWNLPSVLSSIMTSGNGGPMSGGTVGGMGGSGGANAQRLRSKSRDRDDEDEGRMKRAISSPDIAVFSQTCPNIQLCRFLLPDQSVAVVTLDPGNTVRETVELLLARRGEGGRQVTATNAAGEKVQMDSSAQSINDMTVKLEW